MRISDWSSDVCSSDLKITVERIAQSVHHVTIAEKRDLLEKLLRDPALSRGIVFTRTKHRANRVAEQFDKAGNPADAIHGNKTQNARQRAIDAFRTGRARVPGIGRAHVSTPVTNAHIVCRITHEKQNHANNTHEIT